MTVGESHMAFEDGLLATGYLRELAEKLKASQATVKSVDARVDAQRKAVVKAAAKLQDLMDARVVEESSDPDEIQNAKRAHTEAREQLKAAQELMTATLTAQQNARAEVSRCGAELDRSVSDAVKVAASQAEGEIQTKIKIAIQDFVACRLAVEGSGGVPGAQYDLEQMILDTSFLQSVDNRIGAAQRKLRDSVLGHPEHG